MITESTNTSLMEGSIFHQRKEPKNHTFKYKVFFLRINLSSYREEFRKINKFIISTKPKKSILSFVEEDYLCTYSGSLEDRVKNLLKEYKVTEVPDKIILYTLPRIFSYVFNPVSFFLVYGNGGNLISLIAEVHNTFKEKYIYVLKEDNLKTKFNSKLETIFDCCKEFHVSPFFDTEGKYIFSVNDNKNSIDLGVNLLKNDKIVFISTIRGIEKGISSLLICKFLFIYPLSILGTFPRIIYQAFILKFIKGLKFYVKPIAYGQGLLTSQRPDFLEVFAVKMFKKFLSKAKKGILLVSFPDGSAFSSKQEIPGVNAELNILNYKFFTRCLVNGDIGFGESYINKYSDSPDIELVLRFFSDNLQFISDRSIFFSYLGRFRNLLLHKKNNNTKEGSKKNIQAHYDLSNDLFKRFLCDNMMYSSALFDSNISNTNNFESLNLAQVKKLKSICEKASINSNDHVLEIGTGWGGLAIYAASNYGCKVTTVTLSEEQAAFARERIKDLKLENLIDVRICDYREVEGKFSKILSIEMIEAVGREYLPEFFEKCDQLLDEDGKLVIQAILIPDQRYRAYSSGCDWLQKYIFPGGHCPSFSSLSLSAAKRSSLVITSTMSIQESYALTLKIWRDRFLSNWDEIRKYNFDENFKRIWIYYLSYCEAGFRSKLVDVHQIIFCRTIREAK